MERSSVTDCNLFFILSVHNLVSPTAHVVNSQRHFCCIHFPYQYGFAIFRSLKCDNFVGPLSVGAMFKITE